MKTKIFQQCQKLFSEWADLSMADFDLDDPKGFSSFTMGIRSKQTVQPIQPIAVLYRRLEGKENAILDFGTEKEVFLTLGAHDIAAHCHHYDETCRIEAFYQGRTLEAEELFEPENLRQIANELYRFHQLSPPSLPREMFFEMLHAQWGQMAKHILEEEVGVFPPGEQRLCEELRGIYSPETLAKVKRCLPVGELTFCHNDTYHGNIMKLDTGEIKLLDFEFSCLNHKAYDFSNPFAETVMRHQQPDYPYFRIAEPEFGDRELSTLINFYLDNADFDTSEAREREFKKLLQDTKNMLLMSDYKYAMAALPLAIDPIQKIRFIPYAHQRFSRFLKAYEQRFGNV
ncbi:MAG: phosphotransferase [Alphaproteobacteria bacterium]|jgi:thiamine kinase-like enzyme|nr:phosphotransferase [Alphaproteobacteria bacterium]|tara:strand:- start:958 stop:1986 length:1029 start_codon:yes stop_codon:yes gene_type:complete